MLALAHEYKKEGKGVEIWEGIAKSAKLDIITAPGIVVGEYCAKGDGTKTETANGDRFYEKKAESFASYKGHLENDHNIDLFEIR